MKPQELACDVYDGRAWMGEMMTKRQPTPALPDAHPAR
jgi:hypothetical protein